MVIGVQSAAHCALSFSTIGSASASSMSCISLTRSLYVGAMSGNAIRQPVLASSLQYSTVSMATLPSRHTNICVSDVHVDSYCDELQSSPALPPAVNAPSATSIALHDAFPPPSPSMHAYPFLHSCSTICATPSIFSQVLYFLSDVQTKVLSVDVQHSPISRVAVVSLHRLHTVSSPSTLQPP